MTPEQIKVAFDEVLDAPLIYHGFTPYFRDYQMIWYADNAPWLDADNTAERPFLRWLFVGCLRVETTTDVGIPEPGETLFSDRYIRDERGVVPAMDDESARGYIWGVEYLIGFPGVTLIDPSVEATGLSRKYSTNFHEVVIEVPPQTIRIIFHDLRVELREPGEIRGDCVHLSLTDE